VLSKLLVAGDFHRLALWSKFDS